MVPVCSALGTTALALPPCLRSHARPSATLRRLSRHLHRASGPTPCPGIGWPPWGLWAQRKPCTNHHHRESGLESLLRHREGEPARPLTHSLRRPGTTLQRRESACAIDARGRDRFAGMVSGGMAYTAEHFIGECLIGQTSRLESERASPCEGGSCVSSGRAGGCQPSTVGARKPQPL